VACVEVELLVVGVVVGDWRVVPADADELDAVAVEVVAVDAVVEEVLEASPVVPEVAAAVLAWWGVAARTEKSPTPASDPAATQPVVFRLRRSQLSRKEGVVMSGSTTARPQSPLSVASTPRYKFLGVRCAGPPPAPSAADRGQLTERTIRDVGRSCALGSKIGDRTLVNW
jgi:hypothetical protein